MKILFTNLVWAVAVRPYPKTRNLPVHGLMLVKRYIGLLKKFIVL